MDVKKSPFWKSKSLEEMTLDEWESLCDGCGICCCEKVEDRDTGNIELIPISCQFLHPVNCRCMIYHDRLIANPECVELSLDKLKQMTWLPLTCAYRCLAEGRDLEWWHPLVTGDSNTVHQAGISVRDRIVPGRYIHPKDRMGDTS
jgi:uncharacterized cysteine cluster protein YcgN (CxxCxxCC family)